MQPGPAMHELILGTAPFPKRPPPHPAMSVDRMVQWTNMDNTMADAIQQAHVCRSWYRFVQGVFSKHFKDVIAHRQFILRRWPLFAEATLSWSHTTIRLYMLSSGFRMHLEDIQEARQSRMDRIIDKDSLPTPPSMPGLVPSSGSDSDR